MKFSRKSKRQNKHVIQYSSIAIACAIALGSTNAWAGSPFPSVPYYMQSQKINRTKPNLVLLLDNSGSMSSPDADDKHTRRYIAAKNVALKVFDKYKNTFRWGVAFMDEQDESDNKNGAGGTLLLPKDSQTIVNGTPYWVPTLKGAGEGPYTYLDVIGNPHRINNYGGAYRENIDGYIDVPINDVGDPNGSISPSQETKIKNYINSMYFSGNTPTYTSLRTIYNYMSASDYAFAKGQPEYDRYYNVPDDPIPDNPRIYSLSNYTGSKLVMQYRCQKNYVVVISDGNSNDDRTMNFQDPDNPPLGYSGVHPWKMAYEKDYRKDNFAAMPKDLDGESWDDPYFKQQNIITHTIGFRTNSPNLKTIASESGGKYVSASNTLELENALTSILGAAALERPNYIRYDHINFTNPSAILSGNSASSLIPMVTIDPDYWSSYIQFKQLDKNSPTGYKQAGSQDIAAYPITSHESNRTVLATIPNGRSSELYDISRSNLTKITSLNNASFNLDTLYTQEGGDPSTQTLNKDKWKEGYIPWLAAWEDRADHRDTNQWDIGPSYRDRTGQGTYSNAADANMRRHLGDVTRVDMAMMGPTVNKTVSPFNASFALPKFMVVQSNDGMVRIYSAATYNAARPYWERFAYIPGNADRDSGKFLNDLIVRARQNYKQGGIDHEYFMSGSVNYYSTPNVSDPKKQQRYFFIGTLGQGGKAAYALNVGGHDDVSGKYTGIDSNVTSDTATPNVYNANDKTKVPLWDTSTTAFGAAGDDIKGLGYTISNAVVGAVALNRGTGGTVGNLSDWQYATFLPNGYGYTDADGSGKPVIYVIDTLGVQYGYDKNNSNKLTASSTGKAGKVIQKIVIKNAPDHAVLGGVSAVDYDGDNLVDALYVGDDHGNLYRVDLRNQWDDSNKKYTVTTLFQGDEDHPITAAPSIAKVGAERYIVFGTGRNYLAKDIITDSTSNIPIQSVYSIKDMAAKSPTATQDTVTYIKRGDYLQENQLTADSSGLARNIKVKNPLKKPMHDYGWYVDLIVDGGTPTGERVTVKPVVDSAGGNATVFFNTETVSFKMPPNANNMKCVGASASTTSWIYQLNAATGMVPRAIYADKFKDKNGMFAGLPSNGDTLTYLGENSDAVNDSGDSGSSGPLPPGTPPGSPTLPPETPPSCTSKAAIAISPVEVSEIHRICSETKLRRVSWREIPLGYK